MVSGSDRIRQLISAAVLVAGLLPLAAVAQSTNATLDGTKEFQIVANQYSVEFGRSGSGFINILTTAQPTSAKP